jgi:hypothetical protein
LLTHLRQAQPLKLGKNNNDYYIQASLNKLKE